MLQKQGEPAGSHRRCLSFDSPKKKNLEKDLGAKSLVRGWKKNQQEGGELREGDQVAVTGFFTRTTTLPATSLNPTGSTLGPNEHMRASEFPI